MKRDWLWQIKYKNTLYENGTLKSKVHFLESKMQEMEDKMLHIKEKIEEIAPETSEGYCSYSDFDIIGDSPSSTKIHKRVKRKAKTKK